LLAAPLFILQPVDNAEHYLQVFGGRCSLASLYLLDHAVAAQLAALSHRLVLPEIVHFRLSETLLTIRKSDTHSLADLGFADFFPSTKKTRLTKSMGYDRGSGKKSGLSRFGMDRTRVRYLLLILRPYRPHSPRY